PASHHAVDHHLTPPSLPTRRSSDLSLEFQFHQAGGGQKVNLQALHQMLNGHALVGAVHGAAAGGPGFLRLFNAKAHGVGEMARIDRKSTRLNSSHVSISCAVFCLTK